MTSSRVMKWSEDHRDHYTYDQEKQRWVKAACILGKEWDRCTAPSSFARGTKFDYNSVLPEPFIY